jgi:aminopeptidase
MTLSGKFELEQMEQMQAYIGIRGAANSSQFADVPQPQMDLYQQHWWKPVADYRVSKTKWVVLRYPTDSFAQAAKMSTAAFEDFYFDVCTADYAAMKEAEKPLVARMEAADRVRIVAPGTELEFSIKGIPVIPCSGDRNIPDGEVFTAPVRDSINGTIRFNTPSRYQGTVYEGIEFEFKDGKIVRATSNETEKMNKLLDSDEGARYCGEWAIGVNNRVREPMLDRPTKSPTTATRAASIGTWCSFNAPTTAAAKSGSTASGSAKTAASCPAIYKASTRASSRRATPRRD